MWLVEAKIALAALGTIGNLFCIIILSQRRILSHRFNWYILFQSIADLLFTLLLLAGLVTHRFFLNDQADLRLVKSNEGEYFMIKHRMRFQDLSWVTCNLVDMTFESLNAFNVFLILILSVDRLYAILNPLKLKLFFTYKYTKRIIAGAFLAILVFVSPQLFIQPKYDSELNICTSGIDSSGLHKIIYCYIIFPIVFEIVPALVSLILNAVLWFKMHKYTRVFRSSSTKATTTTNGKRASSRFGRPASTSSVTNIELVNLSNNNAAPSKSFKAQINGDGDFAKQLVSAQANEQRSSASLVSCNTSVVVPRNRVVYPVNSYHLIIIITNLLDLPLYFFIVWQVMDLSLSLNADSMPAAAPSQTPPQQPVEDVASNKTTFLAKLIQDVFEVVFIIGHSINILIYMFFHNEFRVVIANIAAKVHHFFRRTKN